VPKVICSQGKRLVSKAVTAERGKTVTAVCYFISTSLDFIHDRTKLELFHDAPTGTLPLISE
jgi:hypothetical protein